MFNFHTHTVDIEPCILNCRPDEFALRLADVPAHVGLSVGLHPWDVTADWSQEVEEMRRAVTTERVWVIGECGLDKVKGAPLPLQVEAFKAQIALADEVGKPMVIHCVKAFDELLKLRREYVEECRQGKRAPQPWVLHGFRGKPEQAKQMMAKGLLLSFCHHYNLETLRFVYSMSGGAISLPFFLETDDCHASVRPLYEQVGRHLGVDVDRLSSLCDPRQTIFRLR